MFVSLQVCPSTRSTGTSSCAPQICCPSPTSTRMLVLLFRCPLKKTWMTCRSFPSKLHCCTPPAKVHTVRGCCLVTWKSETSSFVGFLFVCLVTQLVSHRREEDSCAHFVPSCCQFFVGYLCWSRCSGHHWAVGFYG